MGRKVIMQAVEIVGGFAAAGRIVGRSGKAVEKWAKQGRLPRTEATGHTNYAERLAQADPRIDKDKLIATAFKRRRAPRAAGAPVAP